MSASITRAAEVTDGKRSNDRVVVAEVKIMPLMPVSSEIVQRFSLDTPTKLLTTYCEGSYEAQEGDVLKVAGVEYPIKGCAPWPGFGGTTYELILENIRA